VKSLEPEEVNHIFILSKPQVLNSITVSPVWRCHTWLWFNTSNKSSSSPLHPPLLHCLYHSSPQSNLSGPVADIKYITSSNGKHLSYFKFIEFPSSFPNHVLCLYFPQLYYPRFLASCYCHFPSKLSLVCKNVSKRYELLDIISFSRFYTLKF